MVANEKRLPQRSSRNRLSDLTILDFAGCSPIRHHHFPVYLYASRSRCLAVLSPREPVQPKPKGTWCRQRRAVLHQPSVPVLTYIIHQKASRFFVLGPVSEPPTPSTSDAHSQSSKARFRRRFDDSIRSLLAVSPHLVGPKTLLCLVFHLGFAPRRAALAKALNSRLSPASLPAASQPAALPSRLPASASPLTACNSALVLLSRQSLANPRRPFPLFCAALSSPALLLVACCMSRARHIKHPAPFPLPTRRFLWAAQLSRATTPASASHLDLWNFLYSRCRLSPPDCTYGVPLQVLAAAFFLYWRAIFSLLLLPFPTPSLSHTSFSYQFPPSSSLAHLKSPNPQK